MKRREGAVVWLSSLISPRPAKKIWPKRKEDGIAFPDHVLSARQIDRRRRSVDSISVYQRETVTRFSPPARQVQFDEDSSDPPPWRDLLPCYRCQRQLPMSVSDMIVLAPHNVTVVYILDRYSFDCRHRYSERLHWSKDFECLSIRNRHSICV